MATTRLVKVSITYCAECGYEPQTLQLADKLMKTFGHQLSSIELIPWYEGSFDVKVGDRLVHAMYRDGGFPDPDFVADAVRAELSAREATDTEAAATSVPELQQTT
jgi:selenoprotein W-related protein